MKIKSDKMRLIRAALSYRQYDATHFLSDQSFLDEVERKAKQIYANSHDDRTYDEVHDSTMKGEIGEHSIVEICKQSGLETDHNNEEKTLELYWDVLLENLKCEIKYQEDDPKKELFSFSNAKKDETMRQKWASYDAIIAFYIKFSGDKLYVIPWLLIDNEAINPAKRIYGKSDFNDGHFLKMSIPAAFDFYVTLNKIPKLFTFS